MKHNNAHKGCLCDWFARPLLALGTVYRVPTLIFVIVSASLLALNYSLPPQPLSFALLKTDQSSTQPAMMTERRLVVAGQISHSATLAQLPDGNLVAFWFAGRREGAEDVQIWQAHGLPDGNWSKPTAVMSPQRASNGSYRFIRKLGNPVAMVDARGHLHLIFVTVSMGGWATSRLSQMTSTDGGQTWGTVKPLVLSPFFDMSTLVRTPPVPLANGGRLLPVYHELLHKFGEILQFDAEGRFIGKRRMNSEGENLQPAIVALDANNGLALSRNSGASERILAQRTADGGTHWGPLEPLELNNPNSSVALARLTDGRLLLAYNPLSTKRSELALALSKSGRHWQKVKTIAQSDNGEYSYPTLLVDGDKIHLVYTWNRKEIRHMFFNHRWLAEQNYQ